MIEIITLLTNAKKVTEAIESSVRIAERLRAMFENKESIGREEVAAMQEGMTSIYARLLEAVSGQVKLNGIVQALQAEIESLDSWNEDAARYRLTTCPRLGGALLVNKDDDPLGEPTHYLCPPCFADRKKTTMALKTDNFHIARCSRCGHETFTDLLHPEK